MSELIKVSNPQRFVTMVTLNRPEQRNAMNLEMYRALPQVMEEIGQDKGTRVVILQGAGDYFCAGADVRDIRSVVRSENNMTVFDYWREVTTAHMSLNKIPQPVIAMIRGGARGAGCALAIWANLRYVEENATFDVPAPKRMAINLGKLDTARILITFGLASAYDILIPGEDITAEIALRKNFINEVASKDKLEEVTMRRAEIIAKSAPLAVTTPKVNIEQIVGEFPVNLKNERVPWMESSDPEIGITAFVTKAPTPEFTGS